MTDQTDSQPVDRYLSRPDLESAISLYEAITGKTVTAAEREELYSKFADGLGQQDPTVSDT